MATKRYFIGGTSLRLGDTSLRPTRYRAERDRPAHLAGFVDGGDGPRLRVVAREPCEFAAARGNRTFAVANHRHGYLAAPSLAGAIPARAQRCLERTAGFARATEDQSTATRNEHRPRRRSAGTVAIPMTRRHADDVAHRIANLEVLDEQRLADELRRKRHGATGAVRA